MVARIEVGLEAHRGLDAPDAPLETDLSQVRDVHTGHEPLPFGWNRSVQCRTLARHHLV